MSIYDSLNNEQREAVFCTEGPLLMLAGAGTGKTRSLTHRIVYLIEEKGVKPWNILAITFTNKAAEEMRERACALVGPGSEDLWISTFHATCSRILRRHADQIGYNRSFTIYDAGDQKSLMKEVLKSMNIDTKQFPEKAMLAEISRAKEECKSPLDYRNENADNFRGVRISEVYEEYQKRLRENDAMDFDDLLMKTVELFQAFPDVLEYYQERFRYIMVDEYQDTNTVQFILVKLLASRYRNLCVVGDDDQSIYRFRGANIFNILNFEKYFPDARVIRLEQNYRSTQNILNAANGVIVNNKGRKEKKLWTEHAPGELVHFKQYDSEYDEAEGVASYINFLSMRGVPFEDMAILYRTNAQSRIFEEKLKQRAIPYAIVRGVSFYDRKEIKDLMAYLKTVDSGSDDLAVKRIINVPKRGIGQTTVDRIQNYAILHQISFLEAVFQAASIPEIGRSVSKIRKFGEMIREFRDYAMENDVSELLLHILEVTGYRNELEIEGTDEAESRLADIDELISDVVYFEENQEEPTLTDFLVEKEERRLCDVGITRAKERLYLSAARRRMQRGQAQYNRVSRFVDEIPEEYLSRSRDSTALPEKKENVPSRKYEYGTRGTKPYRLDDYKVKPLDSLEYTEGDRVKHIKFGEGTVAEIVSGGKDFEVSVDFDRVGRKKMFASFAKLKKI